VEARLLGVRPEFAWLDKWMDQEGLTVDAPWPEGADPSGGIASLIQYAWEVGTAHWTLNSNTDGVAVRSIQRLRGLPVFSLEWSVDISNSTMQHFVDLNLLSMAERAAAWDSTFAGADYLATLGSADENLSGYARLVRWKFNAAPLGKREMLYLVVPFVSADETMISYISVRSTKYPTLAGYTRAKNLVPSFDLARRIDGGIHVRHLLTTSIGGLIPNCLWNGVFKGAVLKQAVEEAQKVRAVLGTSAGATTS